MSNPVPEGWEYKELGDYIVESVAGEWGQEALGDENDIPVLRSTNFTASGVIDYTKLAFRNIDEKKRVKKSLKQGDILLEKSGGSPTQPVGRVVYFDKKTPHLYSNFTQKLVPAATCDSKYLFYKLYSEYQKGTVLKFQQQTTGIINFQLSEYLGFKSVFAPFKEQQKIATILSSVDDVIDKTRSQIDKLKDLKTGMMQELLTKGVGHSGFKDSPVGRIPTSWSTYSAQELLNKRILLKLQDGNHGSQYPRSSEFLPKGVPYIAASHISEFGEIDFNRCPHLSQDRADQLRIRPAKAGDVILTHNATVGRTAIIPCDKIEVIASTSTTYYRTDPNKLLNKYLFFYFQSTAFTSQIQSIMGQTTRNQVPITAQRELQIILPPIEEQIYISEAIESVAQRLQAARMKLQMFQLMKKSLMQDLLTGKVRVEVNAEELSHAE